jgi:hypothetical protein
MLSPDLPVTCIPGNISIYSNSVKVVLHLGVLDLGKMARAYYSLSLSRNAAIKSA